MSFLFVSGDRAYPNLDAFALIIPPLYLQQVKNWFEQQLSQGFTGVNYTYDEWVETGHHRREKRQIWPVPPVLLSSSAHHLIFQLGSFQTPSTAAKFCEHVSTSQKRFSTNFVAQNSIIS